VLLLFLLASLTLPAAPPAPPVSPVPLPEPLAIDGALVVVWHEGDVTRAPVDASAAATPPLLGEQLIKDTRLEARAGGRLRILVAGDRLLALEGPGAWLVGSGQVLTLVDPPGLAAGRPPRVEPLATYREGPLPTLEAGSSQPLLEDMTLPPTLLVTHPIVPVTRHDRPDIRWHWPYPGGRFDLLLEEVDGDGHPLRVIERWRNLAGRSHALWAPLERGQSYRLRLSHRAEEGASPIADERVFHVLAPSEIAAVDGAVASLDELQRIAPAYRPEVDVLRARLLESHGLWDEAESVWTGLTLLYPGRDELLHQALRLRAKSLVRPK